MNNQKEFYDEFKDLDFDLTLIKIINEDYYEKINLELIKKIISEKLIEIYFSSDQVILDLVSGKILQHLKNNSEILSYLKGTKRIINFVESIKREMPKWKTTKSSKQLNLFESEDDKNKAKTINYANDDQYLGEIKNGLRNGKGKMTYSNGNIYSGDWIDDVFHGKGTYLNPNGQSISGDWENGYLIRGQIIFFKGVMGEEKYIGEVVYSFFGYPVPHGMGAYFYMNGDKYVGEFVDYKREGKGTFTWANGDSYCGFWQDDEYHGNGILNKDGVIKEGNWINGELEDN
tara:strand:+ start:531 stop:1394 length:864 start_codon:yes stop_codon:yes gene_type:complete